MFSIKLPETMLPILERDYNTGEVLSLNIKVIIDEPTLTGFKCLVCSVESVGEQTNLSSTS